MLPQFLKNLILALNSFTRVILKLSNATERVVDGADEVATLAFQRTKQSMLADLQKLDAIDAPATTTTQTN